MNTSVPWKDFEKESDGNTGKSSSVERTGRQQDRSSPTEVVRRYLSRFGILHGQALASAALISVAKK